MVGLILRNTWKCFLLGVISVFLIIFGAIKYGVLIQ